ncbi:MAG TPA: hypothetical protein V6C78_27035 [Crinalium sp.]|jgi:hypothetical protein
MAESSESPSTPPTLKGKMHGLLWKGVVSVVSLTTATAVPILVQRALVPPATVTPASTVPATASTQVQPQTSPTTIASPDNNHDENQQGEDEGKHRNRNKPKKH